MGLTVTVIEKGMLQGVNMWKLGRLLAERVSSSLSHK